MAEVKSGQQEQRHYPIEHSGEGGELFLKFIVNWILSALTLGVYSFWGKTRIRRYLWAHTQFDGEPFEYTGRGAELFFGAVLVGVIFALLFGGLGLLQEALLLTAPELALVLEVVLLASLVFLFGVAEIRKRIYLVSRTQWRGVAMSLDASSLKYATGVFFLRLLNLLCLGFLTPVLDIYRMRRFLGRMRFGSGEMQIDYRTGQIYFSFLISYIPSLVLFFGLIGLFVFANRKTLISLGDAIFIASDIPDGAIDRGVTLFLAFFGVYIAASALATFAYLYYESRKYAHIVSQSRFEGLRFTFVATFKDWAWLYFGNLLLFVFTLGIGYPLVAMRNVRFGVQNLRCDGQIDYARIVHVERKKPRLGEGLAEALDLGGV